MKMFSVACMTNDQAALIDVFVKFYLRAGAAQVLLYADGRMDPRFRPDDPRVSVVDCDEAFWRDQGVERPRAVEHRQEHVYRDAHDRCAADWLLLVDTDEFMDGDVPIEEFLAAIPDEIMSVRVATAEAVYLDGDDIRAPFGATARRLPLPSRRLSRILAPVIYGLPGRELQYGLAGHAEGKQFLRTGVTYDEIGLHHARANGRLVTKIAHRINPPLPGMHLVHYDAVSFAHWTRKWRSRVTRATETVYITASRKRQLAAFAAAWDRGEAELERLFRRTYCLNRRQVRVLSALGRVILPDAGRALDPASVVGAPLTRKDPVTHAALE